MKNVIQPTNIICLEASEKPTKNQVLFYPESGLERIYSILERTKKLTNRRKLIFVVQIWSDLRNW